MARRSKSGVPASHWLIGAAAWYGQGDAVGQQRRDVHLGATARPRWTLDEGRHAMMMQWSELTAIASGWLAFVLIFAAALVPVGYRLRAQRRAAPRSRTISIHVIIGVSVAGAAFVHGLFGVMQLGSPGAIAGGNLALFAGAAALLVLMAHVGIGLQLRDPKLKRRPQTRAKHLATAFTIMVLALVHAVTLWTAG